MKVCPGRRRKKPLEPKVDTLGGGSPRVEPGSSPGRDGQGEVGERGNAGPKLCPEVTGSVKAWQNFTY